MAIDPNRWTLKTQEAFNAAAEQARANANPEITPDHVLAALLRQPEGVVIPPGATVKLKPKALHIMFMGLKQRLMEGEEFTGTLTFEKAGTVTIDYEVAAPNADMSDME